MKKFINLITILTLTFIPKNSLSQGLNFSVPEEFMNYKERAINFIHFDEKIGDTMYHHHYYDLDGDGIADVGELYLFFGYDKNGTSIISKYPIFYSFNLNGNDKFEENEILFDETMDDLNGNEKLLIDAVENEKTKYGI